jgi:RNA polymerase sigma-70 factor (ECF subfamily)
MKLKLVEAPIEPHEREGDPVVAARSGDEGAFRELYRRYGPMVHAIALSHAGPDDADDVVQDAFTRAWRNLGSLREVERFGAWLAEIARNAATDVRRKRRPTVQLEEVPVEGRPYAEAREVLRHLQALPEAYRETLVMRLVEGMTGPEIALRTGLTEGSVRVNLHRGMKLLKESLEAR